LDEVEQNIVICQWRADQLFADAEGEIEFNNCFIIQQDNVFLQLTSTLVSQFFIPTPSARFHFVQNFNILHKKYKISKCRFRQ